MRLYDSNFSKIESSQLYLSYQIQTSQYIPNSQTVATYKENLMHSNI
jgi:hypothetical protein